MKKVFISVPMSGRLESDVRKDIAGAIWAIRELYGEGVEIIHNYDCEYLGMGTPSRLWYLGEAIKQLGECDVCYFVKGWDSSNGCLAERKVCELYDIECIEGKAEIDGRV